jgi:molecular chaperone DnaK (HSP70)
MNKILPHSISTNKIVNENGRDVEICDFVIKKGTFLPASSDMEYEDDIIYSTAEDNQTVIDNYIYEGEGKYPFQNKLIGNFSLKNIPPKKKGEMKYKFVFKVDENGIISVEEKNLSNLWNLW